MQYALRDDYRRRSTRRKFLPCAATEIVYILLTGTPKAALAFWIGEYEVKVASDGSDALPDSSRVN